LIEDDGSLRKEPPKMRDVTPNRRGYVVAAAAGAIAGGLFVALVTKAMPKMMSAIMQNMMARMRDAGCNPEEM
jgi:hypothetical protein